MNADMMLVHRTEVGYGRTYLVVDMEPLLKQFDESEKDNLKNHLTILNCFLRHAVEPAGAHRLAKELPDVSKDMDMRWYDNPPRGLQRAWNIIAHFYVSQRRFYDALLIFEALYHELLRFQDHNSEWLHKAQPLVKISDLYLQLGCPVLAKRYFMYTLCDDAIVRQGACSEKSGVYERISWYGMSEALATEYHNVAYHRSQELGREAWFPERLLSELDLHHLRWMAEYPTAQELSHYRTNPLYIRHLMKRLGKDKGKSLERTAYYLVSMIPGTRVYRRKRTESGSDYDVVGSFEGPGLDFRSEFGRYFLCECKDWAKPADISVMAKTAHFLDSTKCKFGILFSKDGTSGQDEKKHAEYEQLKVYTSRGIAIVVVSLTDLERLADGDNFLSMLRTRYEKVRLGIADTRADAIDGTSLDTHGEKNA